MQLTSLAPLAGGIRDEIAQITGAEEKVKDVDDEVVGGEVAAQVVDCTSKNSPVLYFILFPSLITP